MGKKDDVRITNGDLEAWVTEREAVAYERHGWTRADDGSSEEPVAPAPPEPPATTRKAN